MATCARCSKSFEPLTKNKLYTLDGLCGKCRSRKKYLENVDTYRKTKLCPMCGKTILNTSKLCNSCSQIGTKNHQWKETKEDAGIYNKREYKVWRASVLKRFNNKCAMCESKYRLAAHHVLPKRLFPDRVFDIDNGVALCHKHHSQIQFKEEEYTNFFSNIIAELKIRELGEPCDGNT